MCDLSIIIPNYNSGLLLEESLESIFTQTTSLSFEVFIFDNCSTDNPEGIVEKFPFENLFFFSEPDSGIYDAMNKGVRKARGSWYYFLGAGDRVVINNLESVIDKNKNLSGIIYGDVRHLKSNYIIGGQFDLFRILRINLCHQAILFNASVFEKLGGFSKKYPILSDYHFNLKLFFDNQICKVYEPKIFSYYRGGGISELKKDYVFNRNKNIIIIGLLFQYFSLNSLFSVSKYYRRYFFSKVKITFKKTSK